MLDVANWLEDLKRFAIDGECVGKWPFMMQGQGLFSSHGYFILLMSHWGFLLKMRFDGYCTVFKAQGTFACIWVIVIRRFSTHEFPTLLIDSPLTSLEENQVGVI